MKHETRRVRHELKRRTLEVAQVEQLSPGMLRLTLAGEDLEGFTSLSPDDHIKVFAADVTGADQMRDYTPRRYDAGANTLVVDFAMHEAGPITAWARGAKVGDTARIGGPRGSVVVPQDYDWWLLVGDETALPAIGRRVEELEPGTPVTTIVAVIGPEEEQVFQTEAALDARWVHRPASQNADASALLSALEGFEPPAGEGFVWIAAESSVARALRVYVLEVMQHPQSWFKASGYWTKGLADTTEKFAG